MQRILFVIGSLEVGGTEVQLVELIKALYNTHKCYVFTLQAGGPLSSPINKLGVPIFSGGMRKGDLSRRPWKILIAQVKLFQVVHKLRPEVIHSFLPIVTLMGALAGRIMRVPLIVASQRSLGTYRNGFPILRWCDLLAYTLSHRVTVNSQAVWDDVVRLSWI